MKEAAVVGVPDRLRGEVPVAYIVADGTLDAAALEAECRQKLAAFKVPRGFLAVEQLPPQRNGKDSKTPAAKLGDAEIAAQFESDAKAAAMRTPSIVSAPVTVGLLACPE